MTEEEIRMLLDELGELYRERDVARIEHASARAALVPPEIQTALRERDAEFSLRDAAIALNIEELEKEIKQAVLAHGTSVEGAYIHAAWTPNGEARVNWDTHGLDPYAAQRPDVLVFRSEGEPSTSRRKA